MRRLLLPTLAVLALAACSPGASADGDSATAVASAPAGTDSMPDARALRADTARIMGSPDARVWLLEVSDFECPFCKTWHDDVFPTIVREYVETGKVRIAYVNYPLANHRSALPSALASMCAGAQGAFWPYHDRVFASQTALTLADEPRTLLDSLAVAQQLDVAAFAECMDDEVMLPIVRADAERMREAGVNATPSFFVGGQTIAGAQPIEVFRRALDAAIAAADSAR